MGFAVGFRKGCTQLHLGKLFGNGSIRDFLCWQEVVYSAVVVESLTSPVVAPSSSSTSRHRRAQPRERKAWHTRDDENVRHAAPQPPTELTLRNSCAERGRHKEAIKLKKQYGYFSAEGASLSLLPVKTGRNKMNTGKLMNRKIKRKTTRVA